jgi:hypothetical protein
LVNWIAGGGGGSCPGASGGGGRTVVGGIDACIFCRDLSEQIYILAEEWKHQIANFAKLCDKDEGSVAEPLDYDIGINAVDDSVFVLQHAISK